MLSSLLYGVLPTDAVTFVAVSLLLTAVGMVACYIPARRATKDDRPRAFVALTRPDGRRVVDAVTFQPSLAETSEARLPDGGNYLRDLAVPTPAAPNRVLPQLVLE